MPFFPDNNTMENLTSKTLNREVRYTGLVQQRNGIGEKDYTNYSKEPQLRLLNHKNTGKFVTIHESGTISLQRQATLEGFNIITKLCVLLVKVMILFNFKFTRVNI